MRRQADDPCQSPPQALNDARRVLVVDDNHDCAELLAFALQQRGHITSVAHNGPDALRIAQSFAPHIAILDVGLPGMDGYELARSLRSLANMEGVRLIALTGYGHDSDRQRAMDAGFDCHFVKPVDLEAFESVLQR